MSLSQTSFSDADLLVFIFILFYFKREISKSNGKCIKRGKENGKPVKKHVEEEWMLTSGPRGPWWGQPTPPWSLWPLRCLPSVFLPPKTYSCTVAFRLGARGAVARCPKVAIEAQF